MIKKSMITEAHIETPVANSGLYCLTRMIIITATIPTAHILSKVTILKIQENSYFLKELTDHLYDYGKHNYYAG